MMKKIITAFLLLITINTSFAYEGAYEFIIRQKNNTQIHLIDYYNVLVVLKIKKEPFGDQHLECGVFPLDTKTRVGHFGENVVDFSNKEYGNLNGTNYFYVEEKTHVSLYRKACNNFIPKKY